MARSVNGDHELLDWTVAVEASAGEKQRRRLPCGQVSGQRVIEHQVKVVPLDGTWLSLRSDHGGEQYGIRAARYVAGDIEYRR